jgi:aldose 1-epimerase
MRSYRVDGRDVIDGYAADGIADAGRGQTLIPWPNRVKDGRWSWQGNDLQLALSEPKQRNAIHGLVRWLEWSVLEHDTSAAAVGVTVAPQSGYEWRLDVRVRYALDAGGLTVEQSIINRSGTPAPVAAGAHPYITVGTETIDSAILQFAAETWLPTGDQQIPTGVEPVAGTAYDFSAPRAIGAVEIDYAFTDLGRDGDGRFRLRLSAPDSDRTVTFWVDEHYPYVELFTGDTLADDRRRRGLGVEPMTAPPNALATGEALVVLEPDESWTGRWGISA